MIALVDANGALVVEYRYDTWGKPLFKLGTLATTLGTLNPFRYRGYVYDEETGLYYLRSRYYNPTWGRFVNADELQSVLGAKVSHNLFAYTMNAPIFRIDSDGYSSENMSVWGGILDIFGAFHISGGFGFGLRLNGDAVIGNVPISLSIGEKVDFLAADWGNGEFVVGGAMARGADVGIGEFFSVGGGSSVFHPYTKTKQCTCESLTFDDMMDCPAATASSNISGQIGIGVEAYLCIGGNLSASLDIAQIDRGFRKIINGIADFLGNLF